MKSIDSENIEKGMMVWSQNRLVNSKFVFNKHQLELLFYILHVFSSDEHEYVFPLTNISSFTGEKWSSEDLSDVTDALMMKNLVVEESENWEKIALFERVKFNRGIVTITVSEFAMPYFAETKNNFTCMELESALILSSKYSKRLYWCLSQWKKSGYAQYNVVELRDLLDMGELYSKNFDFKKIIEKSCREISEKSDILVVCEWGYQLKKLNSVRFNIECKKNMSGDNLLTFDDGMDKVKAIKEMVSCGLTDDQALEIWSKNYYERFKEVRKRVSDAFKSLGSSKVDISNPVGYLVQSLYNDGILEKKQVDLEKLVRDHERELFNVRRQTMIDMICESVRNGMDLNNWKNTMSQFNIGVDDLSL